MSNPTQPLTPKFNKHNFIGGGFLLYAGGLFLLWRAALAIAIGVMQAGFVPETAVVTQASSTVSTSSDSPTTRYYFQYEYTFNDRVYRNGRYSITQLNNNARLGVNQFEVGDQIDIHVNPRIPRQSVVERRAPSIFVYFGLFIGGMFVWMATGLTFYGHVAGLAEVRMARQDAKHEAFAYPFLARQSEPEELLAKEVIDQMPRSLARILGRYLKNGNGERGAHYLHEKTKLPLSVCQEIMKQLELKRG